MSKTGTQAIYLDNAASTRPYPEVAKLVYETMCTEYANPSSLHAQGKRARALVEQSRRTVAEALDVEPDEVYFCSGGTEANNLALCGAAWAHDSARTRSVVCSTLEHPSVTKTVRTLRRSGWSTAFVDCKGGTFNQKQLEQELGANPVLVATTAVQNELGYAFPLKQIAALRTNASPDTLFHVDAVQAFGKLEFLPHALGVDTASISAHKLGGPKGIGALYVKRGVKLFTTSAGGGQERGLRSGTEALPLIVGFAKAVELTFAKRAQLEQQARTLSHELRTLLTEAFLDATINSREDGSPFILSFSLPRWNNAEVLEVLSNQGIYLSAASACASNRHTVPKGTWRKKHPLALQIAGLPRQANTTTYRASFFAHNTVQEVQRLVAALKHYEADFNNKGD